MPVDYKLDKSAWDRLYSTSYEIYEFDKSKIVSESQKFILNAQTTFISLQKTILVSESLFSSPIFNFGMYSNAFKDNILENEKITSSSLNPKIIAFAFYALKIIPSEYDNYRIFFDKKNAKECIELVRRYLETQEFKYKNTELYDFLKKTGTNCDNLIRYFIFFEKMYPAYPY